MSYEVKEADKIIKPEKEFPFDTMKVNEYFEFKKDAKLIARLRIHASQYKKKTEGKKVFRVSEKTLTCQRIK